MYGGQSHSRKSKFGTLRHRRPGKHGYVVVGIIGSIILIIYYMRSTSSSSIRSVEYKKVMEQNHLDFQQSQARFAQQRVVKTEEKTQLLPPESIERIEPQESENDFSVVDDRLYDGESDQIESLENKQQKTTAPKVMVESKIVADTNNDLKPSNESKETAKDTETITEVKGNELNPDKRLEVQVISEIPGEVHVGTQAKSSINESTLVKLYNSTKQQIKSLTNLTHEKLKLKLQSVQNGTKFLMSGQGRNQSIIIQNKTLRTLSNEVTNLTKILGQKIDVASKAVRNISNHVKSETVNKTAAMLDGVVLDDRLKELPKAIDKVGEFVKTAANLTEQVTSKSINKTAVILENLRKDANSVKENLRILEAKNASSPDIARMKEFLADMDKLGQNINSLLSRKEYKEINMDKT